MRSLIVAFALLVPAGALGASGKITFVEGAATRAPAGGAAAPAAAGLDVVDGDTLETGPGARLELALSDGSVARLDERSKLVVDSVGALPEQSGGWRVRLSLALGQVWSQVTRKVGEGAGYEVHTERAVAGVRGTEFLVAAAAEHEIEVYHGRVEVALRGQEGEAARFQLGAGQRLGVDARGHSAGASAIAGERPFSRWAHTRSEAATRAQERLEEQKERRRERRDQRRECRRR
jgi:hypothetical protein